MFAHRCICVSVCVLFISVLTEGLFSRTDRVDHYVEWDGLRRKVCLEIALICIWLNLNHKHKATRTSELH